MERAKVLCIGHRPRELIGLVIALLLFFRRGIGRVKRYFKVVVKEMLNTGKLDFAEAIAGSAEA